MSGPQLEATAAKRHQAFLDLQAKLRYAAQTPLTPRAEVNAARYARRAELREARAARRTGRPPGRPPARPADEGVRPRGVEPEWRPAPPPAPLPARYLRPPAPVIRPDIRARFQAIVARALAKPE